MFENLLKKFRESQKAKIGFCIGGLLFSIIYLLWMFGGNIESWIPSSKRLEDARQNLKKVSESAKEQEAREKIFAAAEKLYKANLEKFWDEKKHGIASVELRKKIEQSAQRAGIKLGSVGAVRQSRINNDLHFLEIDMSATETLELLTLFLREIYKETPELHWKRADFRHEHLQNSERLVFSGTIRLIGIEQNDGEQ